jgi:hypothetical protein
MIVLRFSPSLVDVCALYFLYTPLSIYAFFWFQMIFA